MVFERVFQKYFKDHEDGGITFSDIKSRFLDTGGNR